MTQGIKEGGSGEDTTAPVEPSSEVFKILEAVLSEAERKDREGHATVEGTRLETDEGDDVLTILPVRGRIETTLSHTEGRHTVEVRFSVPAVGPVSRVNFTPEGPSSSGATALEDLMTVLRGFKLVQ